VAGDDGLAVLLSDRDGDGRMRNQQLKPQPLQLHTFLEPNGVDGQDCR
jgi:hypothetical protein